MDIFHLYVDFFLKHSQMYVPKEKILLVIEAYGRNKGYPTKSYLRKFVDDFKLNYNQWSAYIGGSQNAGLKALDAIKVAFPNINFNWVYRDDYNMLINENNLEVNEPNLYSKENFDDLQKQVDIYRKKLNQINQLSKI